MWLASMALPGTEQCGAVSYCAWKRIGACLPPDSQQPSLGLDPTGLGLQLLPTDNGGVRRTVLWGQSACFALA